MSARASAASSRVHLLSSNERADLAGVTTDPEVQRALVHHPDSHTRAWLACNPHLTVELQHVVMKDPDVPVRVQLARNTNLVPELQMELARDGYESFRSMLARNPSVTPDVQRLLLRDPRMAVRGYLTLNPNLLPETLDALVVDSDRMVRWGVLENPSLVLRHSMDVAFLQIGGRGPEYLEQELKGTDPVARAALEPTWAGTLGELLAALRVFAQ